jgi:hypothetical protein
VRSFLTGHGTVTAVIMEHFGASQAAAPTLVISGQGTGATAAVVPAAGGWVSPQGDEVTIQPASGP